MISKKTRMMDHEEIAFTEERLAELFTEWERRYREEPRKFQTDYERFKSPETTYGRAAAAYLLLLEGTVGWENEDILPEPEEAP